MGWRTYNDRLGLGLLFGLPGLWLAGHWYPMPSEAIGATIAVWTMTAQYFFRKAPPGNGGNGKP